jgi:hypothetical protein
MRAVRVGSPAIFPREHNIVDVFTGIGWEHHSVFKLVRKGNPRLLEGHPLTDKEYTELKEQTK